MKKDNWPTTIITTSKPNAFPSALRQKRSIGNRSAARTRSKGTRDDVDGNDDDLEDEEDLAADGWPSTQEPCPACDNPELLFKAVQLRSADEGTTIFYRCARCGHRSVLSPSLPFQIWLYFYALHSCFTIKGYIFCTDEDELIGSRQITKGRFEWLHDIPGLNTRLCFRNLTYLGSQHIN